MRSLKQHRLQKPLTRAKNKSVTAAAQWAAAFYYLQDIINAGKRLMRCITLDAPNSDEPALTT
jgi:hypothetical protein